MRQLRPGDYIDDRYCVQALLGEGAFGVVYKASQVDLSRTVAIKILKSDYLSEKDAQARFLREARLLCDLAHRNIVRVLSFGTYLSAPYLVMEFLEGITLAQAFKLEPPLSVAQKIDLFEQICDAMSAASQQGIIHRDLKPANIFLVNEAVHLQVKILDFGLSKVLDASGNAIETLTKTGSLLGTVEYMSPEACRGTDIDVRSDIYAVGCIFCEALLGQPPFDADSSIGILHKQISEPIPRLPREVIEKWPDGIQMLIDKILQKSPSERFQSFADFKQALIELESGNLAKLKTLTSFTQNQTSTQKSFVVPALIALLLLAAGLLLFFTMKFPVNPTLVDLPKTKHSISKNTVRVTTNKEISRLNDARVGTIAVDDLGKDKDLLGNPKLILDRLKKLEPSIKDEHELAYVFWLKGKCCFDLGKYPQSLWNYKKTLHICHSTKDRKYGEECALLCSLAQCESVLGHNDKSEKYATDTLRKVDEFRAWISDGGEISQFIDAENSELNGWEWAGANAHGLISIFSESRGQLELAARHSRAAGETLQSLGFPDGAYGNYLRWADLELKMNHKDKAVAAMNSFAAALPVAGAMSRRVGPLNMQEARVASVSTFYKRLVEWFSKNGEPELSKKYAKQGMAFDQFYAQKKKDGS